MKNILILFLVLMASAGVAQKTYRGTIINAKTGKPVPYATIRMTGSLNQYSANSDGKFYIFIQKTNEQDTLIITCVGFSRKKALLNTLENVPVILLEPLTYQLHEVNVSTKGNVDFPYVLFSDLVEKYRKYKNQEKSKVYYSFLSECDEAPMEIIEGYFTGGASPRNGITWLMLKNGRIGVCPNKFYSFNTTDILTHFLPFSSEANKNIPPSPGNFGLRGLRKNYFVTVSGTAEENGSKKIVLDIEPRRDITEYFSAKAWVNRTDMTIEKIRFTLNDHSFHYLTPLIRGDRVDSIHLNIEYIFDHSDPEKPVISQVFLNYNFLYSSAKTFDVLKINSEASVLFYDYENPFLPVIPAGLLETLPNDYQKISCLPYDPVIWEHCGLISQSNEQKFFIDYITQNGILINFPKSLDSMAGKDLVLWNAKGYLSGLTQSPEDPNPRVVYHNEVNLPSQPQAYCRILLNPVGIGDSIHLSSATIFDREVSPGTDLKSYRYITYYNLIFDLYELKRRDIVSRWNTMNLKKPATYADLLMMYDEEMNQLRDTLTVFNKETREGSFAEGLLAWYEKISPRTGADRSEMIKLLMAEWPELNVKLKK